jgi:hypothetical protein
MDVLILGKMDGGDKSVGPTTGMGFALYRRTQVEYGRQPKCGDLLQVSLGSAVVLA